MSNGDELQGRSTMPPCSGEWSLAQYMAEVLDETQRATRAAVVVDPCPASGVGSSTETVRCCGR